MPLVVEKIKSNGSYRKREDFSFWEKLDRLDEMVKDRKSVAMVVMAEEIRGKERNMEKKLREEIEWLWNGGTNC